MTNVIVALLWALEKFSGTRIERKLNRMKK